MNRPLLACTLLALSALGARPTHAQIGSFLKKLRGKSEAPAAPAMKIRFAKVPVTDPATAAWTTEFKAGDPIYGYATFDGTLGEVRGSGGSQEDFVGMDLAFDEARGLTVEFRVPFRREQAGSHGLAFTLVPAQADPKDDTLRRILDKFADQDPKPQLVHVQAGRDRQSDGEFHLDLSGGMGGYAGMRRRFQMAEPLPKPGAMNQPAFAAQLGKMVREAIGGEYQVLKVFVVSDAWEVRRDPVHGQPLERALWIKAFARHKASGECRVLTLAPSQPSAGDGTFGRFVLGVIQGEYEVPCEKFADLK